MFASEVSVTYKIKLGYIFHIQAQLRFNDNKMDMEILKGSVKTNRVSAVAADLYDCNTSSSHPIKLKSVGVAM